MGKFEAEYLIEENLQLLPPSPVVTETVTVRRLEPGVYGLLQVAEGMRPKTVHVYTHDSATAPELRELARVALEIAEYLDAQ